MKTIGKYLCLTLILLSLALVSSAQQENFNWYFGSGAGLDFTNPIPIPTTSPMITGEGCASISDQNGNLLLFTDGRTVWDPLHNVMQNGNNLLGNSSSAHSAIIVPNPQNECLYYIFTTDGLESNINGLNYYTVDMSENGGLGKVINGPMLLLADPTEKLAATKHANGQSYWLVSTRETSGFVEVYSWSVTGAGVGGTPNVFNSSHSSFSTPTQNHQGQIKFSQDGSLIAAAQLSGDQELDLFSFDNATGFATGYQSSISQIANPYGVEFSPNGDYLYVTGYYNKDVYQIDISVSSSPSAPIVIGTLSGALRGGGLQIDPYGNKIYAVKHSTSNISSIDNINSNTPTFVQNAVTLNAPAFNYLGTPSQISGVYVPPTGTIPQFPAPVDLSTSYVSPVEYTAIATSMQYDDYGVSFGDIDNDGDLDMIYSKQVSPDIIPVYRENIGSSSIPSFSNIEVPIPGLTNCRSINIIDWNNDGYQDIVAFKFNPGLELNCWEWQSSSSTYAAPNVITVNSAGGDAFPNWKNGCYLTLGDYDGDGDIDGVIGTQATGINHLIYYENNLNTLSTTTSITNPTLFNTTISGPILYDYGISGPIPNPTLHDADLDGDLDIFVGYGLGLSNQANPAEIHYLENQGGLTLGALIINPFGITNSSLRCDYYKPFFADLEGDGCPSLFVSSMCDDTIWEYDQDCTQCQIPQRMMMLRTSPSQTGQTPNIQLQWQDRTDTETDFAIYRKTSFSDPFTLLTTLSQNTTTYNDNAVLANQLYVYKVVALDSAIRLDSSNIAGAIIIDTLLAPLSIKDLNNGKSINFKLYPNPTQNKVKISNPDKLPIDELHVYSLTGRKMNIVIKDNVIDCGTISNGIYFVEIFSGDNKSVIKLIKQ